MQGESSCWRPPKEPWPVDFDFPSSFPCPNRNWNPSFHVPNAGSMPEKTDKERPAEALAVRITTGGGEARMDWAEAGRRSNSFPQLNEISLSPQNRVPSQYRPV
jgi:hypothetical protein